jgi:hypothetical protein
MIRLQSSDPAIAREPGLYTGAASAATINNQGHGQESTTIEKEDFFVSPAVKKTMLALAPTTKT